MLLPPASVDGLDPIVDTIDAQLVGAHADDAAVFDMCGIGDPVVPLAISLVRDPEVPEDGDRPVRRGDVA